MDKEKVSSHTFDFNMEIIDYIYSSIEGAAKPTIDRCSGSTESEHVSFTNIIP